MNRIPFIKIIAIVFGLLVIAACILIVWSLRTPPNSLPHSLNHSPAVYILRTSDGRIVYTLKHPWMVTSAAFSPDGRMLATGSADGNAQLWRFADEERVSAWDNPSANRVDVKFSPDGKVLVTGAGTEFEGTFGYNRTRFWSVADGKNIPHLTGIRYPCVFSPDSKLIADCVDGKIRMFRTADGRLIRSFDGGEDIAFSPDGKLLAYSKYTRASVVVKVQRTSDGRQMAQLASAEHPSSSFSPDNSTLAVVDSHIKLWREPFAKTPLTLNGWAWPPMQFSPDGKYITGSTKSWPMPTKQPVMIWRVSDGKVVYEYSVVEDMEPSTEALPADTVAFLPGNMLVVEARAGRNRNTVECRHIPDGKRAFFVHFCHFLDASQDGKYIAVTSSIRED